MYMIRRGLVQNFWPNCLVISLSTSYPYLSTIVTNSILLIYSGKW